MKPLLHLTASLSLLLGIAAGAPAQSTHPTSTSFLLTPASPPDPALKYTLLPQTSEYLPGTAVPLYLSAISMIPEQVPFQGKQQDFFDLVTDYADKPLADLKDPEIKSLLERPGALNFLAQASLRERAGWTSTIQQEGYAALLPSLNYARGTANFLAARARWQLARNDIPACLQTLRILFSFSRHLNEDPALVQGLVGAGIADLALNRVMDDLVQSPAAPNLYWALADLSRPLFNLHAAMGWEKVAFRASLSPLRNGRSPETLSPDEWTRVIQDLYSITGHPTDPKGAALIATRYPRAKQQLIDSGLAPDRVNAMSAPEAVGKAMLATYDHYIDQQTALANLPYWQAAPLELALDRSIEQAKTDDPTITSIPSLARARSISASLDRHIAILQTIEALRAYAASHAGKLPSSLEQLADTPAPIDPSTGKPFDYHLTGENAAELTSPPLIGRPESSTLHYVITLRK